MAGWREHKPDAKFRCAIGFANQKRSDRRLMDSVRDKADGLRAGLRDLQYIVLCLFYLTKLQQAKKRSVLLFVERQGDPRFAALRLTK